MIKNNSGKRTDVPGSRQKSALGNIQNQEMNIPKEAQGPGINGRNKNEGQEQ